LAIDKDAADVITDIVIEPGSDSLDTWLSSREGQESLQKARERADRWFAALNREPALRDVMPLYLSELPSVQAAIDKLPTDYNEGNLAIALREALSRGFPSLRPEQVTAAVDLYLDCLREALVHKQAGFSEMPKYDHDPIPRTAGTHVVMQVSGSKS
jgi:hypothetical protein